MAVTGQQIESPPTGQAMEFLTTAADSGGELLRLRVTVRPAGRVPSHLHLEQEERFEVITGEMTFWAGKRSVHAGPGEQLTVPPRTAHRFRNESDADVTMIAELRPALLSEEMFEAFFRLAREGKTRGDLGAPGPAATARLLAEFEREFPYMAAVPVGLQRAFGRLAR